MVKPSYKAGLQFVIGTPARALDKHDRQIIRSHATRAGVAGRQAIQLHSWISPHRELESVLSVPSPRRVGADFSGIQLPPGVEPYMIQDLVKLIDLNKHGVYPYEICFDVHIVERGWFPYMVSDICCLHSMMFSVRAFIERALDSQLSRVACLHYAQTLQLLQARLNDFDRSSAISDSTIMVVITLAAAAELMGDFPAVANHVKGLETIVGLRGGVRALNTHNNLQVKVCRADLAYALLSGHQPRLLREISWNCFIADRGMVQCSHWPHDAIVNTFIKTAMDTRLQNALRDLHAFSCISNLAYQTTRKLLPETYNEMMISILYRLTNLSFEGDLLQETIRIGLLAFSSAIFMQRHIMEQPYDHLLNLYTSILFRLRNSTDIGIPVPIVLWLTMLHVIIYKESFSAAEWQSVWLDNAIIGAGVDTWPQAREILRSVAWVDFIHDRLGKQVFEAAIFRLGVVARLDR